MAIHEMRRRGLGVVAFLCALAGFAALLVAQNAGPLTTAEIRREFRNPGKKYRPMVRWWWPGGDVTDDEIRREVRLLDEAGFAGGEIQAFRIGLPAHLAPDVEARVDDYLTPAFFGHVRAAAEEARRRGMWVDLTFGSGWPFGGGDNITPELASMELTQSHVEVHGPAKYHGKLEAAVTGPGVNATLSSLSGVQETLPEGWRERLKARRKVVAVIAMRGSAAEISSTSRSRFGTITEIVSGPGLLDPKSALVLTDRLAPDGTLDWDVPEGDWQVFEFVQAPTDTRVIGGVGASPQLVLDHLKRAAIDSHLAAVGERAKEAMKPLFGAGLRSAFCDSLEVTAYLYWTEGFLEQFKKRRGYDLTPYLPLLRRPGFDEPYGSYESAPLYDAPEVGERVRYDYWQTVSDVMIENFYQPFDEWAGRNGLLARVQAHGAPADVLRIYGLANIPETEQLYAGGNYDFLKAAASAGHIYGRKVISSESFVKRGNPYVTTPEKLKAWSDELLTAGVNQIIHHGFPYERMDRPEPGWHPFSTPLPFSSHMNQHNTFWEYVPLVNAYITRLQFLSQNGENIAQVALYRSALAYESHTPQPPDPEIGRELMLAGYNYDHFNADALLRSRVQGGKLVAPSGARYSALLLVDEKALPLLLAEKIADFRRSGLLVTFVNSVPSEEAGLKDWEQKSGRIREDLRDVLAVRGAGAAVKALRAAMNPDLDFSRAEHDVFYSHRKVAGMDVYLVRNAGKQKISVEGTFSAGGSPEEWDPWTGKIRPVYEFEKTGSGTRMRFELDPFGSRLVVFDRTNTHSPRFTGHEALAASKAMEVNGPWLLEAGGKQVEIERLVDWSTEQDLKSFSGTARYETHVSVDSAWLKAAGPVSIDLGEVHDAAKVIVNGKPGPVLLMRPFHAQIEGLLKPGDNTIEIFVTNTWTNQLLSRGERLTWAGEPPAEPEVSGLLGPVRLVGAALNGNGRGGG